MKKIILMSMLTLAVIGMQAQNPQVRTQEGIIEGTSESGLKVFRGVPFAAPPVGDLRWKAPQPVKSWTGVRKADKFGPNPMQLPVFGDMNFGTKEMSEDCLYLNIWTPAKTMNEKLPVLIYFNGGGLMAGSGSEPRYAGQSMARRGIVSITANYREGIFGFFAHPELTKESSYGGSGNYGFLDQVAAIAWVKQNIAAFGGDPERITIVGESAGSMSVSALMASPLCKGLIAQAMGSSGAVVAFDKVATLAEAEKAGKAKAKEMGCKSLKQLRQMSAEELLQKGSSTSIPLYNIDNYFMPEQPRDIYAKGLQAHIPLLVGRNSLEMTPLYLTGGKPASMQSLRQRVSPVFGDATDKVLQMYGIGTDADILGQGGVDLASDVFIAFGTWKWGAMHEKTGGAPVYRYMYDHSRPQMRISGKVAGLAGGVQDKTDDAPAGPTYSGAVHSADIEYAMGTLPTNTIYDWNADDYTVSDIFQSYYVNFVKTGNPNGLGLPEWTPTNGQAVAPVMHIDVNACQKTDEQLEQRYKYIDSLLK